MAHSLIRRAAYEPDPAHGPWMEAHHVLRLGDALHDELLRLYRLDWADAPSLPVRKLNAAARAVVPGLVATARHSGAGTGPSMPWLYTRHQVPNEVIMALVLSWVRSFAPAGDAEGELAVLLDLMGAHPAVWSEESVDLTESRLSAGGTAEPEQRLYGLLPERLASRLANRPFRTAGGELRFRVVSRDQGAELCSWPPQSHVALGRTWYYSCSVLITVQTAPFGPAFRVHTSTHIRRWATVDNTRPRKRSGATVMFDVPVPWPDLEGPRSRLIPNMMEYSSKLNRLAWREQGPAGLLDDLDLTRSYPAPADLAAAPEKWLLGKEGIAAGIVYSHGMGRHEIGTGLMPAERAELDAWVEEGFSPYLRRVRDARRLSVTSKPALLPALRSGDEIKDPEKFTATGRRRVDARRAALRAAVRSAPLEIEIFWRHQKTRDELIANMLDLFDFRRSGQPPVADDQTWRIGGLQVRIRSMELGDLGDPLVLPQGTRREALNRAVHARRAAVLGNLGGDVLAEEGRDLPSLAFVEIGAPEMYPSRDRDPKHALRLGFAHAGRLTQFIQDLEHAEAPLEVRARNACLDGLRQMGCTLLPRYRGGSDIPEDLQYVGLWMVRRNAAGPARQAARRLVAVRVRPGDAEYPVCAWDERQCGWVPYPRLLITLARETEVHAPEPEDDMVVETVDDRVGRRIQQQVRALLYDLRDQPTLLLANSGNLRKAWPALSNGRLVKDMLSFGARDTHQRVAAYGPDLRVVLIRDRNNREETVQWHALGGGGPGFASGVWAAEDGGPDDRVFLSTTDVPPIVAGLKRGMRKLIPDPQWPNAPRKKAWNPQALELTVLGCLSRAALAETERTGHTPDDPAAWAAVVHQSRYHDDVQPLSHPLAQHLAARAEEYVLPSRDLTD